MSVEGRPKGRNKSQWYLEEYQGRNGSDSIGAHSRVPFGPFVLDLLVLVRVASAMVHSCGKSVDVMPVREGRQQTSGVDLLQRPRLQCRLGWRHAGRSRCRSRVIWGGSRKRRARTAGTALCPAESVRCVPTWASGRLRLWHKALVPAACASPGLTQAVLAPRNHPSPTAGVMRRRGDGCIRLERHAFPARAQLARCPGLDSWL